MLYCLDMQKVLIDSMVVTIYILHFTDDTDVDYTTVGRYRFGIGISN